jgi:hypothetical protein
MLNVSRRPELTSCSSDANDRFTKEQCGGKLKRTAMSSHFSVIITGSELFSLEIEISGTTRQPAANNQQSAAQQPNTIRHSFFP